MRGPFFSPLKSLMLQTLVKHGDVVRAMGSKLGYPMAKLGCLQYDSVLEVPCLIAMGTFQGSAKFELQGQDFRRIQFQAHLMSAHTFLFFVYFSKEFVWYSRVSPWISKVLAQA